MATHAGVLLGTAAYMSPEQARGEMVDERTDLWAFGAVLYKMLTARRAFGGNAVSDTVANVLRDEPRLGGFTAQHAASIRTLLRRCLAKERRHRLNSAAAARLEIEDAMQSPERSASGVGNCANYFATFVHRRCARRRRHRRSHRVDADAPGHAGPTIHVAIHHRALCPASHSPSRVFCETFDFRPMAATSSTEVSWPLLAGRSWCDRWIEFKGASSTGLPTPASRSSRPTAVGSGSSIPPTSRRSPSTVVQRSPSVSSISGTRRRKLGR